MLHGFPFAIAGVACAFGIENASTANVKKTNVTAPTKPLMSANLIAFGFCIGRSPILDRSWDVRFVPKSGFSAELLDHVVGAGEQLGNDPGRHNGVRQLLGLLTLAQTPIASAHVFCHCCAICIYTSKGLNAAICAMAALGQLPVGLELEMDCSFDSIADDELGDLICSSHALSVTPCK